MPHPRLAPAWPWIALVLVAAALYLFELGSPYAPTNGDEMVYIHIARLTAASDHWLPLASDIVNMRNTKPPLLFWQAMVAGDWGHNWSLLALRLPSVVYTFLTTALVALMAYRMGGGETGRADPQPGHTHAGSLAGGRLRVACLAAVLYLAFFSTFRYGRVYLTSAPETFWLSLPLFWLLWLRSGSDATTHNDVYGAGWLAATLAGICLGIGMAYKSFALVAPAAAALWCALLVSAPRLQWRDTVRITATSSWSAAIGLGLFALWFVIDPDPSAVWNEFVVGENAGKMSGENGYWHAALFGVYPMWTQLLAYPENAGLLFFVVLGWMLFGAVRAFKRRNSLQLSPAQRIVLVWLLVWLVVFTLPSQRSARYVIPAMPALAIWMALTWDKIPKVWFWITLLILAPALVMLARIGWVMGELQIASSTQLILTLLAASVGLIALLAGGIVPRWSRNASLVACLAVYATFSAMVAPLSTPEVGYSDTVRNQWQGRRIAVPNGFTGQYERFNFILPGNTLVPYDSDGRNTGALQPELAPEERLRFLLSQFDAVVWVQDSLDQTNPSCLPSCQLLGARWHVKSRHKSGEVTLQNVWYPQQWLFRREWLLARQPG